MGRIGCSYSNTTTSRLLKTTTARLKGFDVIVDGTSGSTLCIVDSGASIAFSSISAIGKIAGSGCTIIHGPKKVDPGDSPYKITYPEDGIRCSHGLFALFLGIAGSTLTVYYE